MLGLKLNHVSKRGPWEQQQTMHGVVMEFSREWTNLVFMNFKLITKHTNASFQNIHKVHAPVWCRRLFIIDKSLFWALKNNINNIYRVYGRQCFYSRLVLSDITYSAPVQVEHAKNIIATKYPQPITHPANSPFRVRYTSVKAFRTFRHPLFWLDEYKVCILEMTLIAWVI